MQRQNLKSVSHVLQSETIQKFCVRKCKFVSCHWLKILNLSLVHSWEKQGCLICEQIILLSKSFSGELLTGGQDCQWIVCISHKKLQLQKTWTSGIMDCFWCLWYCLWCFCILYWSLNALVLIYCNCKCCNIFRASLVLHKRESYRFGIIFMMVSKWNLFYSK